MTNFVWEKLSYGGLGEICQVKGGNLTVRRDSRYSKNWQVRWNARVIATAKTLTIGKEKAEQIYKEQLT